jgi:peptidoglycan/xylan/chitin deacetylase (PgdA/CDA1 family)
MGVPLTALFSRTVHPLRLLLLGVLLLGWNGFLSATAHGESGMSDAITASQADVRAFSLEPKPLVTLSFDDASQTVYDIAFPTLNSHGIPATYYFMTSSLNEQWKAKLKDLENHGWEIGSHSRTHPNLTTLSNQDLLEELSGSKADLEGAGLKITGFAYPFGAGGEDAAVLRQVKKYYSYARSVRSGYNVPIIRQYALKTQTTTSSTSIDTMKGWIDSAIAEKQHLIMLMHTVDDTGNVYSISPAVLAELASYIHTRVSAGDIEAVTVQEGVIRNSQAGWQSIDGPQASVQSDIVITNGRILWYLGSRVVDYQHDGYEWVQSGSVRYYELNGKHQTIDTPSHIALESISPDKATAEIILSSADGEASVVSTVTLVRGDPLAEVRLTGVRGTPQRLLMAKDLARRFSVNEGLLVTDGLLEIGARAYGDSAQSFFALESTTDLVHIITHLQRKSHSEYSDYTKGEFRHGSISTPAELPYTWLVGGLVFDTFDLLAEAESGTVDGETSFYTGADASPKTGHTGVTLDNNDAVRIRVTPPAQGNYTLAIRRKAATAGDQYRYQIDGGEVFTRTVTGTGFGYENVALPDLSAQSHIVKVSAVSGSVNVDYVLLVPISRSANTPATIEFPADVARQAFNYVFLPEIRQNAAIR